MSLDQQTGTHFPANPDKFAFDKEVSAVFPDMAVRSIPNFLQAHAAHAKMLLPFVKDGLKVLDIGASRGAFFAALDAEYAGPSLTGFEYHAIDNSEEMCEFLKQDYPEAKVSCMDLTSGDFHAIPNETYDVVCANYVLQFLPTPFQVTTFLKMVKLLRPGGVFILGHKSQSPGESGAQAHEQYIQWRMSNGYTREEIQAKTRALRGAMFPMSHSKTMDMLYANFTEVTETFRFMMFSTVFAVK